MQEILINVVCGVLSSIITTLLIAFIHFRQRPRLELIPLQSGYAYLRNNYFWRDIAIGGSHAHCEGAPIQLADPSGRMSGFLVERRGQTPVRVINTPPGNHIAVSYRFVSRSDNKNENYIGWSQDPLSEIKGKVNPPWKYIEIFFG